MNTSRTPSYPAIVLRALKISAVMLLVWGILAQNAGWAFASEVVIAAVLTSLFFAPLMPVQWSLIGLLRFAGYFLKEALVGGIDVSRRACHPRLSLTPCWIEYPLSLPAESAQVLFLNSVSLLPGTLSVSLKDNVATIHCLSADGNAEADLRRLEQHIAQLFLLDTLDKQILNSSINPSITEESGHG